MSKGETDSLRLAEVPPDQIVATHAGLLPGLETRCVGEIVHRPDANEEQFRPKFNTKRFKDTQILLGTRANERKIHESELRQRTSQESGPGLFVGHAVSERDRIANHHDVCLSSLPWPLVTKPNVVDVMHRVKVLS